jgi:hypothetical protein
MNGITNELKITSELKIDQSYYPIPVLKIEDNYLIYEIKDLDYSYSLYDDNLVINYILNLPVKYLLNNIKIRSYNLNTEVKLFYSIYDDYLNNHLSNENIKDLKKTDISYLGSDVKYFPQYIVECINDSAISDEFKCLLLTLINCNKIDIKKRLELYDMVSNININIGNILLKLSKNDMNILSREYVTFSSLYQII